MHKKIIIASLEHSSGNFCSIIQNGKIEILFNLKYLVSRRALFDLLYGSHILLIQTASVRREPSDPRYQEWYALESGDCVAGGPLLSH